MPLRRSERIRERRQREQAVPASDEAVNTARRNEGSHAAQPRRRRLGLRRPAPIRLRRQMPRRRNTLANYIQRRNEMYNSMTAPELANLGIYPSMLSYNGGRVSIAQIYNSGPIRTRLFTTSFDFPHGSPVNLQVPISITGQGENARAGLSFEAQESLSSSSSAAKLLCGPSPSNKNRLLREFNSFMNDPPEGCSVKMVNDSLIHWVAKIIGPSGTPYENGTFELNISFPESYPFIPPEIRFLTKIYHCNISSLGFICIDILGENWSPALTAAKILLSIMSLLGDPNPDDPVDDKIATLYINDRKAHDYNARSWTYRYAGTHAE